MKIVELSHPNPLGNIQQLLLSPGLLDWENIKDRLINAHASPKIVLLDKIIIYRHICSWNELPRN